MGGKQRTHDEFVELVKESYPYLDIISQFVGTGKRVSVVCKKCNTESNHIAQSFVTHSFRCQQCDIDERKQKFAEKMSVINPNICIVGEYKNSHTKVDCRCLIHNEFFSMTGCNLITGHGCPKCAKDSRRNFSVKSHEEFILELSKISPTIKVKSKYVSAHKKIKCQCEICNFEWEAAPHNLLKGNRCVKCNSPSKGETKISNVLDELNIEYVKQKKFEDCRDINPLPFDFYLPTYNMCIEFQGRQHYEAVDCFGGEQEFKKCQKRDSIKAEYCKNNKIKLLCIAYWDFNNIDKIISSVVMKGE